ncbi:MAG: hypothetical protein AB9903_33535 [Vulcanimicrobiota bacterium]
MTNITSSISFSEGISRKNDSLNNTACSEVRRGEDPPEGIQPVLTSPVTDTVQESTHDDIAEIRSEIDILTKQLNDSKKASEAEPAQKKDIKKSASLTIKSVISAAAGFVTGYAAAKIQENMEKGSVEKSAGQEAALQKSSGDNPPSLREKEKSLSLLISAEEGDSYDAAKDLDIILKSLRPGESIREASESFARLMKSEDYSTCDSQTAYKMIDSSLRPGENRGMAVGSYVNILAAEDDSTVDTNNAYQIIDSLLKPGEKRLDAAECYVRILRGTEDSTYETRDNYTFIDNYINNRDSRKTVTDQFLRVLKQTDGNSGNTRDIFAQFHTIQ